MLYFVQNLVNQMSVYLIGTLDTKGREIAFVRDCLKRQGATCIIVDAGCLGDAAIAAKDHAESFGAVESELFLESTVIATAIGQACDWR